MKEYQVKEGSYFTKVRVTETLKVKEDDKQEAIKLLEFSAFNFDNLSERLQKDLDIVSFLYKDSLHLYIEKIDPAIQIKFENSIKKSPDYTKNLIEKFQKIKQGYEIQFFNEEKEKNKIPGYHSGDYVLHFDEILEPALIHIFEKLDVNTLKTLNAKSPLITNLINEYKIRKVSNSIKNPTKKKRKLDF